MILKLFAVHDDAVKQYQMVHTAMTFGQAERDFKNGINNPKSGHLYETPEHFSLYHLGDYDTDTGKIEALPAPKHIVSAKQLRLTDEERQIRMAGT